MAAVLGQQGYRTALFHSGRFDYLGMDSIIRDRGFDVLRTRATSAACGVELRHRRALGGGAASCAGSTLRRADGRSSSPICRSPAIIPMTRRTAGPFRTTTNSAATATRCTMATPRSATCAAVSRRGDWTDRLSGSSSAITARRSASTTATTATRFSSSTRTCACHIVIAAPGLLQDAIRARQVVSLHRHGADGARSPRHSAAIRVRRAARCWTARTGWRCSSPTIRCRWSACATARGRSFTTCGRGEPDGSTSSAIRMKSIRRLVCTRR